MSAVEPGSRTCQVLVVASTGVEASARTVVVGQGTCTRDDPGRRWLLVDRSTAH